MPEGSLKIALRLAALFRCVVRVADDLGDIAFTCWIAVRLNDQIECFGDLLFDHFYGKIDAVAHHGGQAADRLFRRVGMERGERAIVSGIHGLQHIERFAAAAFTHHDPVGAHAECIDDEVFDRHLAEAFDVLRSCFKADHVGMRGEA